MWCSSARRSARRRAAAPACDQIRGLALSLREPSGGSSPRGGWLEGFSLGFQGLPMVLQRGRNVWRVERAHRSAVLIDGAAFFRAVREALLKARRSVLIVGWDLHSQTRLVGESGRAEDGYPETLAEFLSALVRERPKLIVRLLLWDYSVLYANERELFPHVTLGWSTPEPGPLRPRRRGAVRLLAAPEAGDRRRCGRVLRRPRRDDPALGHARACGRPCRNASIPPASPTGRSMTCRPWSTGRPPARSAGSHAPAGCARPASASRRRNQPTCRGPTA